jgi:hypothetical protein
VPRAPPAARFYADDDDDDEVDLVGLREVGGPFSAGGALLGEGPANGRRRASRDDPGTFPTRLGGHEGDEARGPQSGDRNTLL